MAYKKSNFYLTREELVREIILSKERHRQSNYPKSPAECFTPKLTEYLRLMVNRYANKGQWRGYSYIEDMKSDALLTLCQNAFKYNEEKYDNPFGYYTQIIKYSFITFLEKEELVRDIKDSLWESQDQMPSHARQIKNEILSRAREAAIDRAKERGETEPANKTIKALKKEVEVLNEKINRLSKVIKNTAPDIDVDFEISEILEIDPLPYTGELSAALSLFTKTPTYSLEIDVEIAGQKVTCLSLRDESTKSSTKRILPDTEDTTVVAGLCSIALTVRRDLLVRELRDISGYNIATTYIPTADKMVSPESGETEVPDGGELTPAPKRKPRKKTTDA
jgi:hypothetical protein